MIKKPYDFTFASLMVGQPARPIWSLCAWSKAGQAWIDDHRREYEEFTQYGVAVTKSEVQDLLNAVANADLTIAGMDISHRKQGDLL